MAFGNGPRIVTDGLILSLDASDRNSYVNGSTTWRDLTGVGSNGTLTNGPTFSSNNQGSIMLDGTNDYINFGNITIGTATTMLFWISGSFQNTYLGVFSRRLPDGSNIQTGTGLNVPIPNNGWVQVGYQGNSAGINNFIINGTVYTANSTGRYTYNYVNDRVLFGLDPTPFSANDKQYTTLNIQSESTLGDSGYVWADRGQKLLGVLSAQSIQRYLTGGVSNVFLYNRIITTLEVQQNYNTQKSRFGL